MIDTSSERYLCECGNVATHGNLCRECYEWMPCRQCQVAEAGRDELCDGCRTAVVLRRRDRG